MQRRALINRLHLSLIVPLTCGLALFSNAKAATNQAILFGGNCEPEHRNMFRDHFVNIGGLLTKSGWTVDPLFDGDSARRSIPSDQKGKTPPERAKSGDGWGASRWSIDPIANAVGKKPEQIGNGSKEALIQKLTEIANDPNRGTNDQLLFILMSHGSPTDSRETHGICLSDGSVMRMDDPVLLKALEALKAKGIRLGFVDMSCFGGGSVPVLGRFGCVISSQASNRVAVGDGILNALTDLLGRKESEIRSLSLNSNKLTLEEVFLFDLVNDFTAALDVTNQAQSSDFVDDQDLGKLTTGLLQSPFELDGSRVDPSADLSACYPDLSFSSLNSLLASLGSIKDLNEKQAIATLNAYMKSNKRWYDDGKFSLMEKSALDGVKKTSTVKSMSEEMREIRRLSDLVQQAKSKKAEIDSKYNATLAELHRSGYGTPEYKTLSERLEKLNLQGNDAGSDTINSGIEWRLSREIAKYRFLKYLSRRPKNIAKNDADSSVACSSFILR